ncbi:MAG TPA: cytochrome c [Burkholderiales bacterium]|nr:cytochrome c [Burkholderiales bacterium]
MRIRLRIHPGALLAGAALLVASTPSGAGDAAAGREKAAVCATCHGPHGMAVAPQTPNLAGQPAGYLSAQLKAFRSGTRRNEVMGVVAKPLSDSDIDDLAAWFASIRVSATPPD